MDFPKKQAQRLIPLYLLEYNEKLFENHPNPEDPWGGGGSDYTAGEGIDITNDVISVDNTIAKKSDIPSLTGYATEQWVLDKGYITSTDLLGYATETWVQNQGYLTSSALTNYITTTQLEDALDDYALKTDIPENISDLNNDAGYTTQTWVENQGYSKFSGSYNDLTNKPDLSIYAESSDLATVATSGSYNDLTDKPTIGHGVLTIQVNGVNVKQFSANETAAKTANIIVPTKTSDLTNDSGYVTSSSLATVATTGSYNDLSNRPTFAIVAFSGSYNDLANKPGLLNIADKSDAFTFTETGNHYPPYKWGENMACTSTWICYGNVEVLPIIYLQQWFATPYEFIAYPQYVWHDQNGYHAVYSTEFTEDISDASGARIVLNAPSLGSTWTSVSTYPIYGFDKVHNSTITFTQGGVNKGSFTVNQWQDQTIALDAAGSSYSAGTGIDITNNTISIDNTVALKSELFSGDYNDLTNKPTIPTTATSTSTSTVTPTTGTFVTGTSTNTTNVVNSVTYTPSSETLTFTYDDNTTASFAFLTSSTTVTSGTTSVVTSVTDSTSNAMTGATVSTSTTTTLS